MEYPNKIFVCEFKGPNPVKGTSHFVIVVAASSSDVAKKHVKEKIGFNADPVWMMNAVYPTIWTSDGSKPEPVQVKILTNCSFHTDFKYE